MGPSSGGLNSSISLTNMPGVYMSDQPHTISRREFAALSLAVGATAVAGVSAAATAATETDVQVHTPSGVCDAALIHPGVMKYLKEIGVAK